MAAIFDFVTIGLVVVICLTSRTFRQNPHHLIKDISDPGHFGQSQPGPSF